MDSNWNPIDQDGKPNYEYAHLPINLRPYKLVREGYRYPFPRPKLVREIKNLDDEGYPIISC